MAGILTWKPHLRAITFDGDLVFVLGERERFLLVGRAYGHLAALLDGTRSVQQVIDAVADELEPAEALEALDTLQARGYLYLIDGPPAPDESDAFWSAAGADPGGMRRQLAATPIVLETVGEECAEPLRDALIDVGLRAWSAGDAAAAPASSEVVRVILTPDYLAPPLAEICQRELAAGTRWMLVKLRGACPWIGPIFGPGGPCWMCLAHRLRANRPVETYLEARGLGVDLPMAAHGVARRLAASSAALFLARTLGAGLPPTSADRLHVLDAAALKVSEHQVVRRPQCPSCGDPQLLARRAERPVVLESRPKQFTADGGHRICSPEQTIAQHAALVSPISGVIASLGPLAGRNHALGTVHAASLLVCPLEERPSFDGFHATTLGKGRAAVQGHASALGEAVELKSAIFQGDEPRLTASWRQIADSAVHPDDLQQFSATQLRNRELWNRRLDEPMQHVPPPFDPDAAIEWTPAWSLAGSRRRYLPTSACYIHYPAPAARRFIQANSNGHATGNCLEEAVFQGFLELVERDAIAIWWYNRIRRPAVALDTVGDPVVEAYLRLVASEYERLGWRAWALDLTHDLRIPVYVAVARCQRGAGWFVGFGAHLDAPLALQRAFTELAQLFAIGAERPPVWAPGLEDDSFLYPDREAPAQRPARDPPARHADLRDDVTTCVERAAAAGLETLVVDQTRPDFGLHAVKVVVPGLRHFWPRFAPGRLYDVPVALGWRTRAATESELNPAPLLL
jgi:bacteriocin biosynthesis cyclodehydratase domain-containing protein